MALTAGDVAQIEQHLAGLVGREVWGPRLGVGSFITLELGERQTRTVRGRETTHGEWHLWVYCSAWRIDGEEDVVVASEDAREEIPDRLERLDGRRVSGVSVAAPSLELTVAFDDGLTLRVFPIFSSTFEHWFLYTPDGNVLSAGPGAAWSYARADEPAA